MFKRPLFRNRQDAGRQLADELAALHLEQPLVLGLPRGGVVVAYEIARALDAPLDVIVARKLGAPGQPELGIGAVAPEGVILLDRRTMRILGLTDADVEELAARERGEMRRRIQHYRGHESLPDLRGRTAILVDDGLATGVTALAAIRSVRTSEPDRVILAVGVCASETAEMIAEVVDEFVCLAVEDDFHAVGMWFEDFEQTTDSEVVALLEKARSHAGHE
jgi:putative phosphoribosyl transferase